MSTLEGETDIATPGARTRRNKRNKERAKLRKAKGKAKNEAEASNETEGNDDEASNKKSQDEFMEDLNMKLAKVALEEDEKETKEHHGKKYPCRRYRHFARD